MPALPLKEIDMNEQEYHKQTLEKLSNLISGKQYLGDSVYMGKTNYGIVLTTENGRMNDHGNMIHMEPEVISNFLAVLKSYGFQCCKCKDLNLVKE